MATKQHTDGVTIYRDGDFIKKINVKVTVIVFKKKDTWVAYSPNLKTFGYSAKNDKSAVEDFLKAVEVFFDIHRERNTIELALRGFGWRQRLHKKKEFRSPELPKYQIERGQVVKTSIAA